MTDQERHLPPSVVAAEDFSASDVPHDFAVGTHGRVRVDVAVPERTEQEPFGFKREIHVFHKPHVVRQLRGVSNPAREA